jgi:hypothetical protein
VACRPFGRLLVDGHTIAPPLALGNRDLHALPGELGGSSVVGLGGTRPEGEAPANPCMICISNP